MKRLFTGATLVALAALSTPCWAELRRESLEVGGYLFHAFFDDDSAVDDEAGFGGRLGILFTESHEMEFALDYVSTEDDLFGEDVDLLTMKIGYVYNIVPDFVVSPLLTIGGGFQTVDIDAFNEEETDPVAYGGAGVRFFAGRSFNVRLDGTVQLVFPDGDFDDTLWDVLLQAGIGWIVGGR